MKLGMIVLLLAVLVGVIPGATSWWTTDSYWPWTTDSYWPWTTGGGSCGGYYTQQTGEFTSPNYPSNYPNYAHCSWRIQSTGTKIVRLTFTYVDVESHSTCAYDGISVYDGPSTSYRLLGTLCGSRTGTFSSSRNDLTVVFYSDSSATGRGFVARWVLEEPSTPDPSLETTAAGWETTSAPPSCRWNCGSNFGSCSCSSSCQYYGNCCPDYYDYCYTSTPYLDTTTAGWETTSAPPSCRWNCGSNFGSCSCSSSCQYYGNCCPDYYDYCYTSTPYLDTTTAGWETTSAPPSCRWNCGSNFGSCSCSSSCQYYGNCCPDYYDYCYTSTPYLDTTTAGWETTSDFSSCRWNCGYNLGSCSCSSSCQYYGNCCPDYYDYCYTTTPDPGTTTAPPSCRWNCGYDLGSCSCSSYCHYYGNCCPDYSDYCGTTAIPLPSCRWNCGYDLTECSCLGSCHYYGSCCPDYNDYCYTTAYPTDTTTDFSSCRWNCGYDLGTCSCSSSCQYYGNCCHDYYDYCPATVTPPENENATACGGNLTDSSGEFFSPQYPYDYPNNARCTWRLLASDRQVVHLTFTFVDLEECCDSIRVYDGPTDAYPLLGRLPQDQRYRFNSTRNYLTVVFRSDSSVTRRGFRAEWVFSETPSCRWNCGNSFSQCSCTSSCQYYGNCCYDYYTYCPATTDMPSVTQPICGGQLFESGSISSPYYPNYYHDNAHCVWQLSAPAGQRIFLSFVDLELERCCGCDYINVYDGSSTASPLLGKLCYNDTTLRDFRSSSSYMTVLFRSDSSGVARGFKGFFSSSLSENTARVACSSDSMTIVIQRSYLDSLGISWQNLYVDDHRCRPSANSYEVSFSFPIDMCGTSKTTNNGRVVYNNHVRSAPSQSGEITRQIEQFLLSVHCHMEQDTTVGTVYKVNEIINNTIAGTGRFNASIAFYPSPSFSYPILEFPYEVNLNQDLFVQVQLSRADNTLDLLVDSCVTSPNHDFQARSYTLIQNGCAQDGTVFIYTNGRQYYAQFHFKAFKFLRTHSYVFLQCRVIICADNDYNSRCRQGCRMRKKRSLDSSHHHTETVTLGPFTRKGAESAAKVEIEE